MTIQPTAVMAVDGEHFEWSHICADNRADTVTMPHSGGTWQIVQVEPLTVTPSIHCTRCGTHGWVRDGRWVPA